MDMMDVSMDKHHQYQKDFINNPEMSDVVFILGEEKIYAHRALMGMHSKVFKMMLFNGMKESSQHDIPLPDVEKDTFLLLLGYVYCGTIPSEASLGVLVSLLAAADKFDMPPLKEMCKQQIENFLTQDTVLEVLISATMFDSWELKEKCYEIIDVNPNTIFRSQGFLALSPDVIEDILKRDQIRCEELDAFRALIAWANHNYGEEIKEDLEDIIQYIRFPLMRPCDLYTIVEPEEVVPESLLLEAYRYVSLDPEHRRAAQSARTKARAAISEFPVFDAALQATITLSNDFKTVTKRGAQGYAVVLAKNGYSTGVHRWRVRADGLASNQWVSIGVARSKTSRTHYVDANHWTVSSACQVYCASQVDSANGNGIFIGNNHILECTLDMHVGLFEVKNMTTGAVITLSIPVNEELFPAVGLHTLGNKVWFCDYTL